MAHVKKTLQGFTEVDVLTNMLCYRDIICCGEETLFLLVLHRIDNCICGGNVMYPIEISCSRHARSSVTQVT